MNNLYHPNLGGVENSIKEISSCYLKKGYQVKILCSDLNNVNQIKLSKSEELNGVLVERYSRKKGVLGYFKQFYDIQKLLTNNKDHDLFISRCHVFSFVGFFIFGRKIKYIVPSVYFYQDKSFKQVLNILVQFFAVLLSKKIFVFSDNVKNQIDKFSLNLSNPIKINVGINRYKFDRNIHNKSEILIQYNIPEDKKIILCLGRFAKVKNFHMAIQAIAYLPTDYHLLMVGSGPELSVYKHLIKDLQIENRVSIIEGTDSPELFYSVSDIFLMLSSYEAFGQVLLEAAAANLDIVAFDCDEVNTSVKEIFIGNSTKLHLCNKFNAYDLSNIIKTIDIDYNNNPYDSLLLDFSWEKMCDELLKD